MRKRKEVKNMKNQEFKLVSAWVLASGKALEWCVGNRTFQMSGISGAQGNYERFFPKRGHPTRRNVGAGEVETAFYAATTELQIYRGEKGGDDATMFPNPAAAVAAAKAFLGMQE